MKGVTQVFLSLWNFFKLVVIYRYNGAYPLFLIPIPLTSLSYKNEFTLIRCCDCHSSYFINAGYLVSIHQYCDLNNNSIDVDTNNLHL